MKTLFIVIQAYHPRGDGGRRITSIYRFTPGLRGIKEEKKQGGRRGGGEDKEEEEEEHKEEKEEEEEKQEEKEDDKEENVPNSFRQLCLYYP